MIASRPPNLSKERNKKLTSFHVFGIITISFLVFQLLCTIFLFDPNPSSRFLITGYLSSQKSNNGTIPLYNFDNVIQELSSYAPSELLPEKHPDFYRAPSRIPGYIYGSNRNFFGYVMRDLSQRILSRKIAQSNVLVVSPNAPAILTHLSGLPFISSTEEAQMRIAMGHDVSGSFILRAKKEGHEVHALDLGQSSSTHGGYDELSLDSWWNDVYPKPNWILLAVFDPGLGKEDSVISTTSASRFLKESTTTYIVFGVHTTASGKAGGLIAVRTLLDANYKVQVLSMSHKGNYQFRPNTLITHDNVNDFFTFGADAVTGADKKIGAQKDWIFRAYLFATQGLDLAIPSRREYIYKEVNTGLIRYMLYNSDLKRNFAVCSPNRNMISIAFNDKKEALNKKFLDKMKSAIGMKKLQHPRERTRKIENRSLVDGLILYSYTTLAVRNIVRDSVWFSASTPEKSEAACVKYKYALGKIDVACTTRIINQSREHKKLFKTKDKEDGSVISKQPNLLFLMIDPISHKEFSRMLPKSKALIQDLNFVTFEKYVVVGDNSGPNQLALYSGKKMKNRDSISSLSNDPSHQWLWDELRNELGYVTLKAEDGCIENSNMVQSIRPNTTHGEALHKLFCYDFKRPNCVGPRFAATYLTDYAQDFIETYQGVHWAAFLSFIDSHEDTGTLAGLLDDVIVRLLNTLSNNAIWDNTMVVFLSDHGLHYGPYFQSTQGLVERAQPMLHIHLPATIDTNHKNALKKNSNSFVTAFDVHKTIKDVLIGVQPNQNDTIGSSLTSSLPESRLSCQGTAAIPRQYCILFDSVSKLSYFHQDLPNPPSKLSFYADLPRQERFANVSTCRDSKRVKFKKFRSCKCSTSHRDWFPCSSHPWKESSSFPAEHFSMTHCVKPKKGKSRKFNFPNFAYETRVIRNKQLVERSQLKLNRSKIDAVPPNILFIEVDSVSLAHADRHFPKTREVFHKYHLKQIFGKPTCTSGLCAVDFSHFSLAGPNSMPNQAAALSGCIISPEMESCIESIAEKSPVGMVCSDIDRREEGLRLMKHGPRLETTWCTPDANITSKHPRNPWIFDIAERQGYITLFAEEFCYESSPYVTQDNLFPTTCDIHVHKVFCRQQSLPEHFDNDIFEGNIKEKDPCLEGRNGPHVQEISLDHIYQMWNAYSDVPKLAFLGAMAAHDYDTDSSQVTIGSEKYDDRLSAFFEKMLARSDANSTIIVLRSDHGLQGGLACGDYSTQVEHLRPWTEIIIPQNTYGVEWDKLKANQHRLVTGFDLYKTLRSLMSTSRLGAQEPEEGFSPSVPQWAINLLTSEIPQNRTCQDARLNLDFCRYDDERTDVAPGFGICNKFEFESRRYCTLHKRYLSEGEKAHYKKISVK